MRGIRISSAFPHRRGRSTGACDHSYEGQAHRASAPMLAPSCAVCLFGGGAGAREAQSSGDSVVVRPTIFGCSTTANPAIRPSSSRTGAWPTSSTRSSPSSASTRSSFASPTRSASLIPLRHAARSTRRTRRSAMLKPVLVARRVRRRDHATRVSFVGEGITGWAVEHREAVLANQAHLDPRVRTVPGTPVEPEALDLRPAHRARPAQGSAQHLPRRRGRRLHRDGVRAREAVRRRRRARARQRRDPRAARASGAHRLADRPLQPQRLLRAAPARAAGVEPQHAPVARAHARHRRLQAASTTSTATASATSFSRFLADVAARDRPAGRRRSAGSAARSSRSSWPACDGERRARARRADAERRLGDRSSRASASSPSPSGSRSAPSTR